VSTLRQHTHAHTHNAQHSATLSSDSINSSHSEVGLQLGTT